MHDSKTLPDRKKLTTYLNSAQQILLGVPTVVCATKNKNYFAI
jgi:hypothetical protein